MDVVSSPWNGWEEPGTNQWPVCLNAVQSLAQYFVQSVNMQSKFPAYGENDSEYTPDGLSMEDVNGAEGYGADGYQGDEDIS